MEMRGDCAVDQQQSCDNLRDMIIDTFKRCRKCNYCFTDCPLYVPTRGFESRSPSGIMASIYYALRWDAMGPENMESLRDILYSCTTCGGCEIRCKQSATDLPIIEVIEAGRQLLVDNMSARYLAGATVDYEEGLEGSRFVINNPNATSTCGCGASFSI